MPPQLDWKTEYAYTTGMQAFIYGFPYIYNAKLRHDWVTQARDPSVVPYAAVNHFWHAARVMDATYRDGGCPNNDTLYSLAWLDLGGEPVILSHPDMAGRYFTFELMGFTSDNFNYVGQRTTGPEAGHFAICGPGWHGDLPPGVQATRPAPTRWVLLLGRTLVDGEADLADVHALQAQYRLTPLSLWGKPGAEVPGRRDVYAPAAPAKDPLGPWKTLNAMLAENPPAAASRRGAGPVRPHRRRARPGRGCPARGGQTGPDPRRGDRDGAAAAAVPQRGLGHRGQRLALPPRPPKGVSVTTSCSAPPTSRWPASPPTTRPRRSTW